MDLTNLWPHQSEALEMCRAYVAAYNAGKTDGGALVRMPTGTGKSGVIAVLAAECAEEASCLIVTPWKALRDQIARDVEERFWEHIGAQPPEAAVMSFTPSTLEAALDRESPTILACTHATLQGLHRAGGGLFGRLRDAVGLVLVDEGHREPAPSWALAVRSLRKPCVLFSAIPYRNDQKLFKVDLSHSTTLTFANAVEDGFIRSVEFAEDAPAQDPAAFVMQLMDIVGGLGDPPPRVIVRCGNAAEVADITARLVAASAKAVGVHETFPPGRDDHRSRRVPDPLMEDAQYWVHQFKLIEGIDDPRFGVLAIYSSLSDARALVQQVGRIIRNPGRQPGETALVLADRTQANHWKGYLAFEMLAAEDADIGSVVATLQAYLEAHARLSYYDGTFRDPFDPMDPDLAEELCYRYSANVLDLTSQLDLRQLGEELESEFHAIDRHVLRQVQVDDSTLLIAWVVVANSPVLRTRLFFEYRLGYTLVHARDMRAFVSDSDGRVPEAIRASGRPLPVGTLVSLFGPGSRIGSVSLINTDVGPNSVRRRTIHARSVGDTAPNLFDHSFFPSTAWGFAKTDVDLTDTSRYVGFTRSRVSDAGPEEVTLGDL